MIPIVITLSGCTAIKKDISDYVSKEVTIAVEKKIDEKLASRGISIADIKTALDVNHDGKVTPAETVSMIKDLARDVSIIEARKLVDEKLSQVESKMVSHDQLDAKHHGILNYILVTVLGALSAYLHNHLKLRSRLSKIETALVGDDKESDAPSKEEKKV